jgi:hypothetical protein
MPSPCHSIAPALSGHSRHVYWIALTSLTTLVPSLAGDRHDNAQLWTHPDAPTTPRSCQSVHEHVSGHDRARRRLEPLVLLSLSYLARMITTPTATSWTCSLARPSLVAVAMIGVLPRPYCQHSTMPARPRPSLAAPCTRIVLALISPTSRAP